jgi:hypothetical protein
LSDNEHSSELFALPLFAIILLVRFLLPCDLLPFLRLTNAPDSVAGNLTKGYRFAEIVFRMAV